MHPSSEGVADRTAREYIVQYFVRVKGGAKVDARAEATAARAQVGETQIAVVNLRNIGEAPAAFRLSVRTIPDNGPDIEIRLSENFSVSLAAKAEQKVEIPFLLKRADLGSRDGTIDFEISVENME